MPTSARPSAAGLARSQRSLLAGSPTSEPTSARPRRRARGRAATASWRRRSPGSPSPTSSATRSRRPPPCRPDSRRSPWCRPPAWRGTPPEIDGCEGLGGDAAERAGGGVPGGGLQVEEAQEAQRVGTHGVREVPRRADRRSPRRRRSPPIRAAGPQTLFDCRLPSSTIAARARVVPEAAYAGLEALVGGVATPALLLVAEEQRVLEPHDHHRGRRRRSSRHPRR